jgi:nucleotide-binding universal stress UspA family protein
MYEKILVPVDGSETAALGLEEAIRLAKSHRSKLRLIHVVNDFIALTGLEAAAVYSEQFVKSAHERGRAILAQAQEAARRHGLDAEVESVDSTGEPAGETIVQEARRWPADLIVLGTHGRRGIRRLVLGSDAEYIVRTTPVPVLLVRSPKSPKD